MKYPITAMKEAQYGHRNESVLHRGKRERPQVRRGDGAQWNCCVDSSREWKRAVCLFFPMDDPETVLLIDIWRDQASIDAHHATPMMERITQLREKYDLHMRAERYVTDKDGISSADTQFIRD